MTLETCVTQGQFPDCRTCFHTCWYHKRLWWTLITSVYLQISWGCAEQRQLCGTESSTCQPSVLNSHTMHLIRTRFRDNQKHSNCQSDISTKGAITLWMCLLYINSKQFSLSKYICSFNKCKNIWEVHKQLINNVTRWHAWFIHLNQKHSGKPDPSWHGA